MPQNRKVAFSAKQKKKQLQEKKERKANTDRNEYGMAIHRRNKKKGDVNKINQQPQCSKTNPDRNRYLLHFKRECDEEVERGKALAREPITPLPPEACDIDLDDIYPPGLDMPVRPTWDYSLSKQALNNNEMKYFNNYLKNLSSTFGEGELSYHELNIETWRQLWRVVEMSDVILLMADARHPALHFSPSLHDYVVNKSHKRLVLVLNKIDLVPASLLLAWKHYFHHRYPNLPIVFFTSSPSSNPLSIQPRHTVFKAGRGKRRFCCVGPLQLWQVCREMVPASVDLTSWKEKIEYDAIPEEDEQKNIFDSDDEDDEDDDDDDDEEEEEDKDDHVHGHFENKKNGSKNESVDDDEDDDDDDDGCDPQGGADVNNDFCRHGVLTIGCCGYPNAGKSSLLNSLVGKKVVSVSKTPGHTKHFQTIKLTHNVTLCDSPGLVFPSLISKPLQILSGMYPISQVREPYSCVRFIAERLPLASLLRLKRPLDGGDRGRGGRREDEGNEGRRSQVEDGGEKKEKEEDKKVEKSVEGAQSTQGSHAVSEAWTAYSICDAWAEQRGFLTARAARPDVYRAGNHILRMCEQSRICLCFNPPSYNSKKHEVEGSDEVQELIQLQVTNKVITRR